jgi:hypothetical protein
MPAGVRSVALTVNEHTVAGDRKAARKHCDDAEIRTRLPEIYGLCC